jgi:pimeloyl-ACP methyl ester carboxylesterase
MPARRLFRITCPMLVIWSREDPVLFISRGEFAVKVIPLAGLEIVLFAKHRPIYDRSEICANLMLSLITKNIDNDKG